MTEDEQADFDRVVRERDEALAQVARREREHAALLETAQKALAHAEAERDDLIAELQKTRDDFSSVWDSRDEVIKERERARQACNAYWHDLSRIGSLCEQSADEYPLKAVERTVREFREARRDFLRVADALGLVSTDDTGRIGQVASVDEVVAVARSIESLRAEVEMLRGVGCREAKAGEPESGPCGVCLRCAEEENARLRAALRGLFKPDGIPYAQWTREMHAAHIALESER